MFLGCNGMFCVWRLNVGCFIARVSAFACEYFRCTFSGELIKLFSCVCCSGKLLFDFEIWRW